MNPDDKIPFHERLLNATMRGLEKKSLQDRALAEKRLQQDDEDLPVILSTLVEHAAKTGEQTFDTYMVNDYKRRLNNVCLSPYAVNELNRFVSRTTTTLPYLRPNP